jgi:pimeloyl-ACP methyl ester carboxylesterase
VADLDARATIPGVEHHTEEVGGRRLHWVTAGNDGSPVLLVHGFPETWWVFHRLIPLLSPSHRVIAVDLPGFGDSGNEAGDYSSSAAAETLHLLIARLGLGPVHLSGQDIGGDTVFRLACSHPADVRSVIAIETLLAGFGFERVADVAHGGVWHVGAIATPGVADFVFAGRAHQYLSERWFPFMTRVPGAVTAEDVAELSRAYSRPGAWNGPQGLYAAALHEGEELRSLASSGALQVPVLAVDGMGTSSTATGMRAISDRVTTAVLDDVGHHVALEAPERLAQVMLAFVDEVDGGA